jgi:hypothetical protein
MNIHYIIENGVIASVTTAQYRARTGERKPSSKGTKPPRSRENIGKTHGIKKSGMLARIHATKVYPGGKQLRRAQAELGRRQEAHNKTVGGMMKGKSVNPAAFQKPGSMKTRAR